MGSGQTPEMKVDALLALAPRLNDVDAPVFAFLVGRLNDEVPPLARLAAARALADLPLSETQLLDLAQRFDAAGPLAVPVLLRAYSRTPSEKTGLVLVKSLEASKSATSLSPDELASMLRAFPAPVQSSAAGLLKKLGVDPEQQRLRLEELDTRTEQGDAKRGHDIFYGKKAACAGCHTVAGKGGKVGPDLTTIGAIRTKRDLLEAVVYPSASFARGFRTYIVVTVDGKVHTGVISRETADSVTLRTAELAEIRIPRGQIEEMRESSTSIMPKGLETTLSNDELRDLLAWLRERK
jgi:putative heme-binding domain-containing protein